MSFLSPNHKSLEITPNIHTNMGSLHGMMFQPDPIHMKFIAYIQQNMESCFCNIHSWVFSLPNCCSFSHLIFVFHRTTAEHRNAAASHLLKSLDILASLAEYLSHKIHLQHSLSASHAAQQCCRLAPSLLTEHGSSWHRLHTFNIVFTYLV